MRILWVSRGYWDEGTDHATWVETSRALEQRGHSVTFIVGYRTRKEAFGLSRVFFVPSIRRPGLNYFSQAITFMIAIWRRIVVERPDVVLFNYDAWPATILPALLTRHGARPVAFVMDTRTVPVDQRGLKGRLAEASFQISLRIGDRLCQGMTTITPFLAQTLKSHYGVQQPMNIWTSGVSVEVFDPALVTQDSVARVRVLAGVAPGGTLLMYHGSFGRYRGLDNLVRAMSIVRRTAPDCVLLLLGHGPSTAQLRSLVAESGLEQAVTIHEPVPYQEVPSFIAAADLGVLPFARVRWWRVQSFIKLLEYMAMAKPVVVTDIEAHRHVLGDSPSVFYAHNAQPAGLAAAILRAVQQRDSLPQLGSELRHLATGQYQWRQQAEKLEAALQSAVSGQRSAGR